MGQAWEPLDPLRAGDARADLANVKVPILCQDRALRTLSPYRVVRSHWRALSTRVTGHLAMLGGRDTGEEAAGGTRTPEERKRTWTQSLLFRSRWPWREPRQGAAPGGRV